MAKAAREDEATDYSDLNLEKQLCFNLYVASNEAGRRYSKLLKPLNLTFPQYLGMLAVLEHHPMTVGTFSKALHLDFSTATPLLQRLERMGFVSRRRDREDERRVFIDVTEAGLQLRDKIAAVRQEFLKELGLTTAEVDAVRSAIQLLGRAFQKTD